MTAVQINGTTSSSWASRASRAGQRSIDRQSDGTLWKYVPASGLYYSKDEGATWALATVGNIQYLSLPSLFIDKDDNLHIVQGSDSTSSAGANTTYHFGRPNADHSGFTWVPTFTVSSGYSGSGDVVAHRDADVAGGYVAHVYYYVSASTYRYATLKIAADGTITNTSSLATVERGNGDYGFSIAFRHTGDGKTPASPYPDLYVIGADGSFPVGTRYKRATGSASGWTWSAAVLIDSAQANSNLACVFDGNRLLVGYIVSPSTLKVAEIPAGGGAPTVVRTVTTSAQYGPAISHSPNGDSWITYVYGNFLYRARFDRAAGAWEEPVQQPRPTGYEVYSRGFTLRRSTDGAGLTYDYQLGNGSTYSSWFDRLVLNSPPNAATLTTMVNDEVIDKDAVNRAEHQFSDPDPGDSQSKADHRWRLRDVGAPWSTLTVPGPNPWYDFPAGTFAEGKYERQVFTYDAQGTGGQWSTSGFFTVGTRPAAPTITDPINNATVSNTHTITWSAAAQGAYQVQVLDETGAVVFDTEEVADPTRRTLTLPFEENNTTRTIRVAVEYGGLWSDWYEITVNVSFTRPPAPSYTKTDDPSNGALIIAITNPAPQAGEPAVAYNNVHVDDGDGKGERRKTTMLPTNVTWSYDLPRSGKNYDGTDGSSIRVEAVATNGTTSSSS